MNFKNKNLRKYIGRSLSDVAAERGTSPEETALDLVVEDGNINGHPVLPGWGEGPWEALEDYMARVFDESAQTLEAVQKQVSSIAQELQDGGLLGQAGEAFADALSTRLAPAIARLGDKFTELRQDIVAAKQDMVDADSTSVSNF